MVYFFEISRKEPIEDFYELGRELGRYDLSILNIHIRQKMTCCIIVY